MRAGAEEYCTIKQQYHLSTNGYGQLLVTNFEGLDRAEPKAKAEAMATAMAMLDTIAKAKAEAKGGQGGVIRRVE